MSDLFVMNDEAASDITTSSVDDCPTPTSTTMTDTVTIKEKDDMVSIVTAPHVEYHPIAEKSFMIRTRQEPQRILTLENGQLKVLDKLPAGGGWLWKCVRKSRWYGFCNTVSGTYLGHDTKGNIVAKALHHKADEYFMADRQIEGGYGLLTSHGDELLQVGIGKNGESLIEQAGGAEGAAWDFIDVKSIGVPVQLQITI